MVLRRAYLQIHVEKALWPYQTVILKGQRYCLTRLGFGLNVATLIMKAVIDAVLSQDEAIANATSAYIDDIYVNENLIPVTHVRYLLSKYELVCKEPTRLEDGTKVLGLQVWSDNGTL